MSRPRPPRTRAQWLAGAVRLLRARTPAGRVTISCRPPDENSNWRAQARLSDSGRLEIQVHPELTDEIELLAVVCHELCHAVGPEYGHRGPYVTAWRLAGFVGRPTMAQPGEALRTALEAFAERLGPYPPDKDAHTAISRLPVADPAPSAPDCR